MKLPILFVFVLLLSCTQPERISNTAFYHWQSKLELSEDELDYLKAVDAKRLYIKFFDIDWKQGEASPIASLQLESNLSDIEIVPTVFITNRTIINSTRNSMPRLARQIAAKINNLAEDYSFSEVQLDCDWSGKSRDKYFYFLQQLKTIFPDKTLSATIRLHQLKYPNQSGVPPVDKGMLMCYNVGDLNQWNSENSILDTSIVLQYLKNTPPYALPLDVALPIYCWGILYRSGKLSHIFNNLQAKDLQDTIRFKALSNNRYEVVKATYLNGFYLYEGDLIRLEAISEKSLEGTARLLSSYLPKKDSLYVSYYHLESSNIEQYTYDFLEAITDLF